MDLERIFTDLGVNAVVGTELMDQLGLDMYDVSNNQRFQRFRDVLDYFKGMSEDTARFVISKVVRGKPVDKLDYMFEYVNLCRQRESLENERTQTLKEKSVVEFADPSKAEELGGLATQIETMVGKIKDEIAIYEK